MFRWLTDQYPAINRRLSEGLTPTTRVDNFYLDMNGIIHPCTHGNREDDLVVLDEIAMFKKIFGYVDRLYKLVRPRNVLYLAVDGVAPRAKMNQQRSRRFRSGKEAEKLAGEILARKGSLPDRSTVFDSNCITPGTDFMLKLGLAMNKWIAYKQKTDPAWMNGPEVIFSGPDVPGEGEHKVMDYVREIQSREDDGRTDLYHVLYGLDADLIMLGLVTHEKKFTLLREKMSVVMGNRRNGRKKKDMLDYNRNDFELLELDVLRTMFQIQFRRLADSFPGYDSERIIDDFVCMCALVGNDFLPHVPHLEIDGGALSLMMSTYVDLLPEWGGYLTDKEMIHVERLEEFMYVVGGYEAEHFKRRSYEEDEPGWAFPAAEGEFYGACYERKETPPDAKLDSVNGVTQPNENNDSAIHIPNEKPSYRDFYYQTKLSFPPHDLRARRQHVRDYLEGLHWVLHYYHKGCPSWGWYFPHLYSPLATDFANISELYPSSSSSGFLTMPFENDTPIDSLAQLLSVLPPSSADLLPAALAELMLDPNSPIGEFYPQDFTTDANGKRQPWEAVVKIPFIDADRLNEVLEQILSTDDLGEEGEGGVLTRAERRRNERGSSVSYVPEGRAGRGTGGGERRERVVKKERARTE
eukprot:CAMPEP_0172520456 /NCGR_PEP_ID=MMETSP1066-20121228/292017_1 /TAXON_ID=671091 /ORGANISM="Coscinodiscus wailesii, Strain CCMP2513" /LENGTH=636 /DNA_ID=CAMNT_0013303219 /DNA_START=313 /DNA_END=2223 /DNA_ORIENTATION=-